MSSPLWFHELQPARLLCPWDFPGKNTGVGSHFLLWGNLPKPGMESRSPVLQADSLSCHQGSPVRWILYFLVHKHIYQTALVPLINMASGVYLNNNIRSAWKLPLRCQFLVMLSKSPLVYEFDWGPCAYSLHCDLRNSFKSRFPHGQIQLTTLRINTSVCSSGFEAMAALQSHHGCERHSSKLGEVTYYWRTSLGTQTVKHLSTLRETWVWSLGPKDPLEKETATHSSTLVWKIPWTRSLVGCSPWGRYESDNTEWLHFTSLVALLVKNLPATQDT